MQIAISIQYATKIVVIPEIDRSFRRFECKGSNYVARTVGDEEESVDGGPLG